MATDKALMLNVAEMTGLGEVFVKSKYFADATQAAQAVVKILAGRELGFGPIASMTGIYIVKGRISLSAALMAARIKSSGRYDYRIKELTAQACEIEYLQRDGDRWVLIGKSRFTARDAVDAQLGGDNWKKYPRNMLMARAMSNGAKWFCPDLFSGAPIYTPEELGVPAGVNPETGEVIENGHPDDDKDAPGDVGEAGQGGEAYNREQRVEYLKQVRAQIKQAGGILSPVYPKNIETQQGLEDEIGQAESQLDQLNAKAKATAVQDAPSADPEPDEDEDSGHEEPGGNGNGSHGAGPVRTAPPMSQNQRIKLIQLYRERFGGLEAEALEGLDAVFESAFKHSLSEASLAEASKIISQMIAQKSTAW